MTKTSRGRRALASAVVSGALVWVLASVCVAAPQLNTFAVVGVEIHTMAPGATIIAKGTLVVQRGVVTCVAATCTIPGGARKIEAKGGVLLPGLVESSTHAGLEEVSLEPASGDGTIAAVRNASAVRALDGITIGSRVVRACRNGGVTTLIARPLGRALLSGRSVAFAPYGTTVDDSLIRAVVAVHAHIGPHAAVPKGAMVLSRSGQLAELRRLLGDAAAVANAKPGAAKNDARLARLLRDPGIVALVPVVRGEIPLAIHTHKADAITTAIRLVAETKIRAVLVGGGEAHLVARRLANAKIPVVLSPGIVRPYSFDTLRAVEDNAARLHRAGVTIALSTASSHNARHLRWTAGWAVAAGLPRAEALRAITTVPARIFGLAAHVGTLAVGQKANFALFTGDPLSTRSHVAAVAVGGEVHIGPKQR